MFQIDNSSAATQLPAPSAAGTPGYFTDGNPATGQSATILPAEFMNMLMMELVNVVQAGGGTPDKTKNNQVLSAIQAMILNRYDWSNASADQTLKVGEAAFILYSGNPVSSLPLHCAVANDQLYELGFLASNVTGQNLDVGLQPNNASYGSAFNSSRISTGDTAQNISSVCASGFVQNCFDFDPYGDQTGGTPDFGCLLGNVRVYTGNKPANRKAHASGWVGTERGASMQSVVWDDTSTPYTSLGTLGFTYGSTLPTCGYWLITIRRLA